MPHNTYIQLASSQIATICLASACGMVYPAYPGPQPNPASVPLTPLFLNVTAPSQIA